MISATIQASTLEEFYAKLVAAQQQAHGEDYTAHHEEIRRLADPDSVYVELGVNQGATLACALLAGFGHVWGYDIRIDPIRPYWPLFTEAAGRRATVADVRQLDSRNPLPLGGVDFLLIDSVHTVEHLRSELAVHPGKVRQSILVHDTWSHRDMHRELMSFTATHPEWAIIKHETSNVGYTLMQRTK